ncbi:hypothetical protein [Saccharicrinis fermentans]|uniref:Uncharacterized protein n=1 Tax=Saccharicrinis fermentans DSM 9555 = JCM 21142 TaxID=869213 RepID=W7Y3H8_9BACT|nr:hypothetical protein [Saccharicrinis fermentans]GAF05420.1 hypothetical protein JCM21142_104154 [Saccharicrinis fermentans DSM 9555 = JCM 21142]
MRVIFALLLTAVISFSAFSQKSKSEIIKEFSSGVIDYGELTLNEYSPISSFNKIAYDQADKSITLTKENMASALSEAVAYKACFISVGTYTLVKVTDFNKKVMSGSWGCKLPFGEGYIQKGTLLHKEDYLNNIIGVPSSQRRMMFLFK